MGTSNQKKRKDIYTYEWISLYLSSGVVDSTYKNVKQMIDPRDIFWWHQQGYSEQNTIA